MTPTDTEPPRVRLHLDALEAGVSLSPRTPCPVLDGVLAERGADSLAFLPLLTPKKLARARKRVARARGGDPRGNAVQRALAKARAQLSSEKESLEWHEGTLSLLDEDGSTVERIPAVFSFDLRRYRARLLAEQLGLSEFYWACTGAVEVHVVDPFDDDAQFSWSAVRDRAEVGLRDMVQSSTELGDPRRALRSAGVEPRRFFLTASIVLGLALIGMVFALVSRKALGPSWFHPLLVLVPLLIYLRPRPSLASEGTKRRELNASEAEAAWRVVTPHILAVWILAFVGILLLGLARSITMVDSSLVQIVDDFTTHCLLAFWILTPLAYTRERASSLGAVFESTLTFFIALLVLKFTLFFTGFALSIFWTIVGGVLPVAVPEWIRALSTAVADIGAQAFFFGVFAAYVWEKNRDMFRTWATAHTDQAPVPSPAAVPSE